MNVVQAKAEILQYTPNPLEIIEKAYRVCYLSDMTGDSHWFIRTKIKAGHLTPLEHAIMTVQFTVDRGITHEAVRHRVASPNEQSTRYVKQKNGITVIDIRPGIELDPKMKNFSPLAKEMIVNEWFFAMEQAERSYIRLLDLGATAQMARTVLPQSTKAELIITANLREWRHIFSLRALGKTGKPHPQMVEVMIPLLASAKKEIPVVFDDLRVSRANK